MKNFRLDLSISCNFGSAGRKAPAPPQQPDHEHFFDLIYNLSISCNFQQLWISWQWPDRLWTFFRLDLSISCNFQQLWFRWQKSPLPHSAFHEIPSSYHTCRIPMHPILQIHTLIPPIWISSLSYQLCHTFQNTYIYRSTGHRIMVQVEDL